MSGSDLNTMKPTFERLYRKFQEECDGVPCPLPDYLQGMEHVLALLTEHVENVREEVGEPSDGQLLDALLADGALDDDHPES